MTIREAASTHGTKVFRASKGDSILALVDRIYGSRDELFFRILTTLNTRYDWDNIEEGAEILYLTQWEDIYEVVG